LAIAVATSSVKLASRPSVLATCGVAAVDSAIIAPHARPLTTIGTATAERIPASRASFAAISPGTCA
jgi:hypothetical protein